MLPNYFARNTLVFVCLARTILYRTRLHTAFHLDQTTKTLVMKDQKVPSASPKFNIFIKLKIWDKFLKSYDVGKGKLRFARFSSVICLLYQISFRFSNKLHKIFSIKNRQAYCIKEEQNALASSKKGILLCKVMHRCCKKFGVFDASLTRHSSVIYATSVTRQKYLSFDTTFRLPFLRPTEIVLQNRLEVESFYLFNF